MPLGDGSVDAVLVDLELERAHLAAIEGLDVDALSPEVRFERDLELHNLRRSVFDLDEVRLWARRSQALDDVGDGLFLSFARDHAPLAERLDGIAGRLEAVPTYLERVQEPSHRAAGPVVAVEDGRDRGRVAALHR